MRECCHNIVNINLTSQIERATFLKDKLSNLTQKEITNLIYSIKEIEFIAKNIKK